MDVRFSFGSLDLSERLSTFAVTVEPQVEVITTISRKDYVFPVGEKNNVSVSLWPLTETEEKELYTALSRNVVEVNYTHPHKGEVSEQMRLLSPLEAVFALLSVDGKRRYTGNVIRLRSIS